MPAVRPDAAALNTTVLAVAGYTGQSVPMLRLVILFAVVLGVLAGGDPAAAEQRRIGLTSFDRIEVSGDMTVEVRASHSIFAQVDGSADALDTLELLVDNRVLRVRQLAIGRFGPRRPNAGPVIVRVSAQNLRGAALHGAGRLSIDGLRGDQIALRLDGAGELMATGVDAQTLTLRMSGNGTMSVTGRARNAGATINGGGTMHATALRAEALNVTSTGSGTHAFTATRTADLTVTGTGGMTVAGRPRCTVRNLSSGTVSCGAVPTSAPVLPGAAPAPTPAPVPVPVRRSLRNPG